MFRTSLRWFSRRDQNAWDLRKFCAYKRGNAVWNNFRTHFLTESLPLVYPVYFGEIYSFIYAEIPKLEETQPLASAGSKILGLSTLVIEQGLKQRKGCSLIYFFNPV